MLEATAVPTESQPLPQTEDLTKSCLKPFKQKLQPRNSFVASVRGIKIPTALPISVY